MSIREKARFGKIMLTGVLKGEFGEDTLVLLEDGLGDALFVVGSSMPSLDAGFAKGCLFVDKDVVFGTSGLYVNVGTRAVASWRLVTNAA